MKTKPIHKLNGGLGATLCNCCSGIINIGLTEDLYCLDCQDKLFKDGYDEWMKKPKKERNKDTAKLRQEIIDELHK